MSLSYGQRSAPLPRHTLTLLQVVQGAIVARALLSVQHCPVRCALLSRCGVPHVKQELCTAQVFWALVGSTGLAWTLWRGQQARCRSGLALRH